MEHDQEADIGALEQRVMEMENKCEELEAEIAAFGELFSPLYDVIERWPNFLPAISELTSAPVAPSAAKQ